MIRRPSPNAPTLVPLQRRGLVLAGLLGLVGCGDDDGGPAQVPLDPANLSLVSVASAGGPKATVDELECVPLGLDPDRTLLVEARTANWTLRPLGACGSLRQCGLIRLTLSADDASFDPVGSLSALPTGSLTLVGTQVSPDTPVTLEARLVNDLGADYTDADRLPDAGTSCDQIPECDEVRFRLDPDCGLDRPTDVDASGGGDGSGGSGGEPAPTDAGTNSPSDAGGD